MNDDLFQRIDIAPNYRLGTVFYYVEQIIAGRTIDTDELRQAYALYKEAQAAYLEHLTEETKAALAALKDD